jgi:hypothetical protein
MTAELLVLFLNFFRFLGRKIFLSPVILPYLAHDGFGFEKIFWTTRLGVNLDSGALWYATMEIGINFVF